MTQFEMSMSSPAGSRSRASLGPSPGSVEAMKMTATSGERCAELLPLLNLGGSLAKTCRALLTMNWASSECFLTWKLTDTAHGPSLFRLVPSMPRTDASGSGLWRTPQNREKGGGEYRDPEKIRQRWAAGHQVELSEQARMWPTPNVPNGGRQPKGGMSETGMTPDGKKRQVGLHNAVNMMWPTPRQSDTNGPGEHGNGGPDLRTAAQLWRTPSVAMTNADRAKDKKAYAERKAAKGQTITLADDIALSGPGPSASGGGGSLNPNFVEWMQGYPPGWTET